MADSRSSYRNGLIRHQVRGGAPLDDCVRLASESRNGEQPRTASVSASRKAAIGGGIDRRTCSSKTSDVGNGRGPIMLGPERKLVEYVLLL